jgi:DNA polymerase I-like protein with 3'-5' exonuclease and polymerase domains/5'-3' exonuclease
MARLLIDGPNVLWRALSVGRDPEGIDCADPDDPAQKIRVASAGYGFENVLQMMSAGLARFGMTPKDMVWCWEGRYPTKVRTNKVKSGPPYKGTRGKRVPRAYTEFRDCQEQVQTFFKDLGAAFCVQDEIEADDVLTYLALNAEEPVVVFSHDGDLTRLVGTNPKGFPVSVGNNDDLNHNPYGPFPNDLITLYKALVGDSGDNIKGAKGFGKKTWLEALFKYGVEGLSRIEQLIVARQIPKLNEQAEECKILRLIVNYEQDVYNSHTLALLYPQEVNTARAPLVWTYGMVRDLGSNEDRRYEQWYGRRTLVHAGNYKAAITTAKQQVRDFVALDLETTTNTDSDEWVEARRTRDSDAGIDVLGSEIVSCGLTFGDNLQHTLYLTHRHLPEPGIEPITLSQLGGAIVALTKGRRVLCHNAGGFELPVLRKHFEFPGDWQGFLPDVHCTKILANYANENLPSGLKPSAKTYFDYDQQTFMEVTGGKKMDELTASHVFRYGTDDTVVTAALYNHLSFLCQTEGSWQAYNVVEQRPMYLQAVAFLEGARFSLERMREIEREDDVAWKKAWEVLRAFLIESGWAGTAPPSYTTEITAAEIKEAYEIVHGRPLETQVRTPAKLMALVDSEGAHTFAELLGHLLGGDAQPFTDHVRLHFKGEPELNLNSPKQIARLLYETLKLPVRLRGDLTETMIHRDLTEGNPATNELAVQLALHYDKGGEHPEVLRALLALKTVETRRKMFYGPYRHAAHWQRQPELWIHASFNQCATVTRRYSCSGPNLQQLPKKGEGLRFREVLLPHHDDAVIVSMDFTGQELRLMAEDSQDPVMLACYVGDALKDMHTLTAAGISKRIWGEAVSYETLIAMVDQDDPKSKALRALGKKLNFTVQYGAMARKVGLTLMVEEDVAQAMLDSRAAIFKVSEEWKERYTEQCKKRGYATTRLGARRHLREAFAADFRTASKAERQGPNFRIQGSGAEMTKLAMGAMWDCNLFSRFDAVPIGPVHDEYVASVAIKDLVPFLQEMHACMTQPYGGMKVPVVSSISFGPSFGEQIEIGEEPTEEAINKGLSQMREMREERLAA